MTTKNIKYWLPSNWPWKGMALFGYIIAAKGSVWEDDEINHEIIHFKQQKQLWYVGFFIWYILEFILRFSANGCKWMEAYESISFEGEAYDNTQDLTYADKRKTFDHLKYF